MTNRLQKFQLATILCLLAGVMAVLLPIAQAEAACPAGFRQIGTRCVPIPPPQQGNCPSNMVRLSNGRCGCPNGMVLRNGQCVRAPSPTLRQVCPPNSTWKGTLCKPNRVQKQVTCGPNQVKRGNRCLDKTLNCGRNQVQRGNRCVTCGPNQLKQGNSCVPKPTQQQLLQKQLKLRQQLQQQRRQGPCKAGFVVGPNGRCVPGRVSDIRLKRDIKHVATRADGLKLYSFRYLWDDTAYVGVMAQDLLADPARADAVHMDKSGYYTVDYGELGLTMKTLEEWLARNGR